MDSIACYQSLVQDIGADKIYQLHQQLISNLLPDLTFFIDVEAQAALQRALSRNNGNKFEAKNLEFHQQVSQGFHALVKQFPERIVKINANHLNSHEVHQQILQSLSYNFAV